MGIDNTYGLKYMQCLAEASAAEEMNLSEADGDTITVIPNDDDNLALCAIITVTIQMSCYLIACACKFDKITDIATGSNYIVLAAVTFGLSGVRGSDFRIIAWVELNVRKCSLLKLGY